MEAVLTLILLACWGLLALHVLRRAQRKPDQSIMSRVDAEFFALAVISERPEFCFDGVTAQIVDEHREVDYDRPGHTRFVRAVQRFARNAHGEYFYFSSEGSGSPFFKHVPHNNAKAALGKKYIAPSRVQAEDHGGR